MAIDGIDHLYFETTQWEKSVEFWEGLGFRFSDRWGSEGHRAGRLEAGAANVVLAEVAESPTHSVFFSIDDLDEFSPGPGVEVTTPPHDTHWGTRLMRATDPDGRSHAVEQSP